MHQGLSSNNFTNECSRFKAIFTFSKLAWIRLNRPDQIGDALNHSTARRARNTLTSYRLPPLLPLLPPPLLLLPPIQPPLVVGKSEPLLPPPLLLLPPIRPPLVGNSQPVFTMAPPDHRTGNVPWNPLPALLPRAPASPPAWPLVLPPDHRVPTHLPPLLPRPLRRASLL